MSRFRNYCGRKGSIDIEYVGTGVDYLYWHPYGSTPSENRVLHRAIAWENPAMVVAVMWKEYGGERLKWMINASFKRIHRFLDTPDELQDYAMGTVNAL